MEKRHESIQIKCLNCGTDVKNTFCHHCGQRVRDNSDRSVSWLLGEFLGNLFFIDNRFLLSVGYLIRFPGRMTVEFLGGKRKKFISPISLFLFFNLIYFLVNPLSDYSLPLYDQTYSQPYSGKWMEDWIRLKLQNKGLDWQAYSIIYQKMSDNIAKSIMIINVPLIALFMYAMVFKRRRYYFDSLIFAFHYFSVFMASLVMLSWANTGFEFLSIGDDSIMYNISFMLFTLCIPVLYAMLSIKKFLGIRWFWAIPAGLGVVIALILSSLCYRFIIFIITFWFT